jgi:NitT/TauT family transport system permease protein
VAIASRRIPWFRVWRPLATAVILVAAAELLKRMGWLPVYIPAPSQIVAGVVAQPSLISQNLGPTVRRASTGYAISALCTLVAASLAVTVRPLYGVDSIPIIATAPLLALWIGTGESLQVTIAALACQFPMVVGAIQGLQAADARQRELMEVLSANRFQTLRYLLIPSAVPYLLAGFKIAAPSAVLGAITGEWAGADRGIGAMMLYALSAYNTPTVWLAVLITSLLAAIGYGIWALVESFLVVSSGSVELAE